MERRAQGISLNVIIIAAISLVVLVILVALVFNWGGNFKNGTTSCEALGTKGVDYQCVSPNIGEQCPTGWKPFAGRTCAQSTPDNPKTCCIPV